MRSEANEATIRQMWADYNVEGLAGILRWTVDDLRWRPWSGGGRILEGVEEYSTYVRDQDAAGIKVVALLDAIWSDGDDVFVRGRTRTHSGATVQEDPLFWLSRLREGRVFWTSSAPTVPTLLDGAGLDPARAPEIERALEA